MAALGDGRTSANFYPSSIAWRIRRSSTMPVTSSLASFCRRGAMTRPKRTSSRSHPTEKALGLQPQDYLLRSV